MSPASVSRRSRVLTVPEVNCSAVPNSPGVHEPDYARAITDSAPQSPVVIEYVAATLSRTTENIRESRPMR